MTCIQGLRAPICIGVVLMMGAVAARAAGGTNDEPRVSLTPRVPVARGSDIRVESNLVLIPVSVTDTRNHPVTGLSPEEFRVFEGKAEQRVLHLSSEEAPLSVGIVFDGSGSMAGKLEKAREAAIEDF